MSRLTTTIKIASVVIGLGAVSFGALVYRQAHPPLPPGLATLAGTHLSTAQGSPILLGQAAAPATTTIVSFWATWCIPCRDEARALAALRQRYSPRDLAIVYLNVDETPNPAAMTKFLQATHATALRALYAGHAGWTTITGTKIMVLPRTYVFDRTGAAQAVLAGFDGAKLDDSVSAAMR